MAGYVAAIEACSLLSFRGGYSFLLGNGPEQLLVTIDGSPASVSTQLAGVRGGSRGPCAQRAFPLSL